MSAQHAPTAQLPTTGLEAATWETMDWHTGGEPFRIVTDSPAAVLQPGLTVAERRMVAIDDAETQRLRALLCSEPRGHADMYGGFVVPGDDDGAHFGVLFWHKDGFSTACGHGTIALGAWAVRTGLVPADPDGVTDVVIDVPSGRVTARVRLEGGRVRDVTFVNVASHVHARGVHVKTPRGVVTVDISFGGAMYAVLPAASVGLTIGARDLPELIATGRAIRDGLNADEAAVHPNDPRLSGIYGTIFTEDLGELTAEAAGAGAGRRLHQRNVVVFSDGEVDRSPCGSGTAARVAMLADEGHLGVGDELVHESVVGSRFVARVVEATTTALPGGATVPAVIPAVTGTAHPVALSRFVVDEGDDLTPGFVLR